MEMSVISYLNPQKQKTGVQGIKSPQRLALYLDGKAVGTLTSVKLRSSSKLAKLGITDFDVYKTKGKEPVVVFNRCKDIGSDCIAFLQKTENKQMKAFLKMLENVKDFYPRLRFSQIAKIIK